MTRPPGHIKVTHEAVYALLPALDKKITAHIEAWRDAVPVGTLATIADMMNHFTPDAHGLPVEIVMSHIFPPDGSPCAIPGVVGVAMHGPLAEARNGHVKWIKKEF